MPSRLPMGYQFTIFSDHKALESLDKIAERNPRVQRWMEFLAAYNYTLEYRRGSANGNADFLSRLPLPATELDRCGASSLTPSDEELLPPMARTSANTPFPPCFHPYAVHRTLAR